MQAVLNAPAAAVDAVSGAVDSVGRAAAVVKDGAYGAVDTVARVANAPAQIAERRRLEQQVITHVNRIYLYSDVLSLLFFKHQTLHEVHLEYRLLSTRLLQHKYRARSFLSLRRV